MKTPQKPIANLSKILGINNEVWLKFENRHNLGSHKGRSLPIMIDENIKLGKKSFVISSSGNAALAALRFINSHNKNRSGSNINLKIFIGESIPESKKEKLMSEKNDSVEIIQTSNPKQNAFNHAKKSDSVLLRSSTDPLAPIGYSTLAEELSKIENLSAIFFASSSGTSALGTHLGFKNFNNKPQIHIVQTASCHPLVNHWRESVGSAPIPEEKIECAADAIVDQIGFRKEDIKNLINETGGAGWILDNNEILEASKILSLQAGENISTNGALAFGGLKKALQNKFEWRGPVACIIGGD